MVGIPHQSLLDARPLGLGGLWALGVVLVATLACRLAGRRSWAARGRTRQELIRQEIEAWQLIGATLRDVVLVPETAVAPPLVGATAPFTGRLLRDLIPPTVESRIKAEPFLSKLTNDKWTAAYKPPLEGEDSRITRLRAVIQSSNGRQVSLVSRLALCGWKRNLP